MKDKCFEEKFIRKLTKDFVRKLEAYTNKQKCETREQERKYNSNYDWPTHKNLQPDEEIVQSLINLRDELYRERKDHIIGYKINSCLFRKW